MPGWKRQWRCGVIRSWTAPPPCRDCISASPSFSAASAGYGSRCSLFGSRARDDAREGSDADVLVAFDGPADSRRYFGLQFYLEDLLGCPVDLVTEQALRPQFRPFIERDAIRV